MKGKRTKPSFQVAVSGASMRPTLRESAVVEVAPYCNRPVRRGDVIVFTPHGETHAAVHRVVRVMKEGIRTRGDNNRRDDARLVRPEDVAGRVVAVWRGRRRKRVAGGWIGCLIRRSCRPRRILNRILTGLLHAPYRALARLGLVRRFLPKAMAPRAAVYKIDGRDQLRLLFGGRVVGRYDARRREWIIQRPFRLFVDESSLPPHHQGYSSLILHPSSFHKEQTR